MFKVEVEQEVDGRWIAEVPDLSGTMVYGTSRGEAVTRAQALALRVLAERLEHGEDLPGESFDELAAELFRAYEAEEKSDAVIGRGNVG